MLLHALCHYALWAEIILVDFNLDPNSQTAKFNSPSNFPANGMQILVYVKSEKYESIAGVYHSLICCM